MSAPATLHVFSTGTLRVGTAGSTALTSSNVVNEAQDVTFENTFTRKETNDAASIAVYATDSADHEGKATIKATVKDVSQVMLPYQTGATMTTSGGQNIYTFSKTSVPQACRVEFAGVSTTGLNLTIIATNAKPKGFNLSAKLTDFADNQVEFDLYPDPSTGTVVTVSIDE